MSLPGLELAEASVESQYAAPPPTQVVLRPGSEWRFEIAFGLTIQVKVFLLFFLVCCFLAIYETDFKVE
jgi:hypothetical protein